MTPRGGYRPGAGRKRLTTDEPTVTIRVRMPQSYRQHLLKLGKGIISVGLRLLIKEDMEINNDGYPKK